MLTKTRGIVLRKVKYGETSLILDVFTEEYGLMPYIIGGVRQAKARTGTALLQVMAIIDLVAYHSEKTKLHRIKEAQAAYIFQNIPGDIRKNAIILFMAELCSKTIRLTEKHETLYRMIETSIIDLDQGADHLAHHHLLFMIQLADQLGFGPEEQHRPADTVFDLLDGRFVDTFPEHQYYLTDASEFNQYLQAARSTAPIPAADRLHRNQILDQLLLYFQLHLDKMPEMHAHKILREIL